MKFLSALSQKLSSTLLLVLFSVTFSSSLIASRAQAATVAKPVVTIVSPGNASVFNKNQVINFIATANDPKEGNLNHRIVWHSSIDGNLGMGASLATTLSSGTHKMTAFAKNSKKVAGSAVITITVKTTTNKAPVISISSPANNDNFDFNSVVYFTASAVDTEDGDLSHAIEWSSNLDGFLGTGQNISSQLSVGVHSIKALVTDSNNAKSETEVMLTMSQAVNTPPSIAIQSPGNNAIFEIDTVIFFTATSSDLEDGDLSHNIQWTSSIDGSIGVGKTLSAQLSTGDHLITASIVDSENLLAETGINLTVFEPINQAPVLSINAPGNNSEFDEYALIHFSAMATDAEDGNLNNSIQWHSNIDGQLGLGGNFSTTLSPGSHIVTATVTDSGALSHSREVVVIVNPEQNNNDRSALVSWTAPTENVDGSVLTDLKGYKIYYGTNMGSLTSSVSIEDPYQNAYIVDNLMPNTTYYFTVIAYNENRIESGYSSVASKFIP